MIKAYMIYLNDTKELYAITDDKTKYKSFVAQRNKQLFHIKKVKMTSDEFDNLYYLFLNADSQFEILLYAIIATDKFDIASGYYEIACCLTNCLSYLSIGTHSKEMASHYLRIGSEKDKICNNKNTW